MAWERPVNTGGEGTTPLLVELKTQATGDRAQRSLAARTRGNNLVRLNPRYTIEARTLLNRGRKCGILCADSEVDEAGAPMSPAPTCPVCSVAQSGSRLATSRSLAGE